MFSNGIILAALICIGTLYDYNHKSFDVVEIEGRNYGLLDENYRIVQELDGKAAYKPMRPSYVYLLAIMPVAIFNMYIGIMLMKSGIPGGLSKFDEHIS